MLRQGARLANDIRSMAVDDQYELNSSDLVNWMQNKPANCRLCDHIDCPIESMVKKMQVKHTIRIIVSIICSLSGLPWIDIDSLDQCLNRLETFIAFASKSENDEIRSVQSSLRNIAGSLPDLILDKKTAARTSSFTLRKILDSIVAGLVKLKSSHYLRKFKQLKLYIEELESESSNNRSPNHVAIVKRNSFGLPLGRSEKNVFVLRVADDSSYNQTSTVRRKYSTDDDSIPSKNIAFQCLHLPGISKINMPVEGCSQMISPRSNANDSPESNTESDFLTPKSSNLAPPSKARRKEEKRLHRRVNLLAEANRSQ